MKRRQLMVLLGLLLGGCGEIGPSDRAAPAADTGGAAPHAATGADATSDQGLAAPDTGGPVLPAPGLVDADGDGYDESVDCDDADPTAYPGGWERCDRVDNDCDGTVDDGLPQGRWYRDLDGDGFGDAGGPSFEACGAPEAWVTDALDCDDALGRVSPDALELCDGLDNDCDGAVDDACVACTVTLFPGDSIQDALDAAADGDLICLEPGTYIENLVVPPTDLHLLGVDGPAATTVEAATTGSVVTVDVPVGLATVIEGLRVRGGKAYTGGGLFVDRASPTLRHLVVRNNLAFEAGGGLYLDNFDGELIDVRVRNNEIVSPSMFGGGGGIYISGSDFYGQDLVVEANQAVGSEGGGVYMFVSGCTIDGLTVRDNVADYGAGLSIYEANPDVYDFRAIGNYATLRGGGVYSTTVAFPLFDHALVAGNVALFGGGVYSGGSDLATWRHALFVDNRAPAAAAMFVGYGTAFIEQSAFVGNHSEGGRGALAIEDSNVSLDDVVVSHNSSLGAFGGVSISGFATFTAQHSVIWGNAPADITPGWFAAGVDGNLSTDPLFLAVDAPHYAGWDVHLQPGSPLIDAGSGVDPDGSAGDIGVFGGAGADQRDLDRDGEPSWWVPGSYDPAISPGTECADLHEELGAAECGP